MFEDIRGEILLVNKWRWNELDLNIENITKQLETEWSIGKSFVDMPYWNI